MILHYSVPKNEKKSLNVRVRMANFMKFFTFKIKIALNRIFESRLIDLKTT